MNQILNIQLNSGDQILLKLEYSTTISRELLLERIPLLLGHSKEINTIRVPNGVSKSYVQLARFLLQQENDEIEVTFSEIEKDRNQPLPPSARVHRAWWGNTENPSHVHATSWMLTGWKVESIDLENEVVKFIRN